MSNLNNTNIKTIPASKQVNRVGKYLYKHLNGAYNMNTSSNTCDVYVTLLYQLPRPKQIPGKGKEYNDVHEMTLNLNITTYQNKLRVNIIEMTPQQRTLSFETYSPELMMDLENAKHLIYGKVVKAVKRAYKDYNILF